MHNWEEWEISPPLWSPHSSVWTEGPCGSRWRLPGGFRGLKRFPCPAMSLHPPGYCLSASSDGEGEALAMCPVPGVPLSLSQLLAEVEAAPHTTSVVVTQPLFLLYTHGCAGNCTRSCGVQCHHCVSCMELCWHPGHVYWDAEGGPCSTPPDGCIFVWKQR